jgi:hypothetical protein
MTNAETLSITTIQLKHALALVRQAQMNLDALNHLPEHVPGVRDARWSLGPAEDRIEQTLHCIEPAEEAEPKGNILDRLDRLRSAEMELRSEEARGK